MHIRPSSEPSDAKPASTKMVSKRSRKRTRKSFHRNTKTQSHQSMEIAIVAVATTVRNIPTKMILGSIERKTMPNIYTIEEWREQCDLGNFIDFDGIGYLGTEDSKSKIQVWPSIAKETALLPQFTHIWWYNR